MAVHVYKNLMIFYWVTS